MFKRAYLEITNVCNRSCAFCPGCSREKKFMTVEEFSLLSEKLRPYTEYLYLHVMGEPLLHPFLKEILEHARSLGFKTTLTTNGTLLKERGELLCESGLYKLNVSLHSFEANGRRDETYFENCFAVAESVAKQGTITVLRLWNMDGDLPGMNRENDEILAHLESRFPQPWKKNSKGFTLRENLYLEYDKRFIWPMAGGKEIRQAGRCHGLLDQIAVLCDGTVVPCCLDGQGSVPLGNLFDSALSEILDCPRALAMKEGFLCGGRLSEHLCRTCGYAARFDK
jgi:MoaA/NifB/PqqE/SkfB family radical SAM enzyme